MTLSLPFTLPDIPKDGYTIRLFSTDKYEVFEWKAIYHVNTPWGKAEQTSTDRSGVDFVDHWQIFWKGHFEGRSEQGWRAIERLDFQYRFYVTREEAVQACVNSIRDAIARLQRDLKRMEDLLAAQLKERAVEPKTYDEKVITCFEHLSKENGEGASPAEVTGEMDKRGWLSPLDTVIDIKDIMQRLRFTEGRL